MSGQGKSKLLSQDNIIQKLMKFLNLKSSITPHQQIL